MFEMIIEREQGEYTWIYDEETNCYEIYNGPLTGQPLSVDGPWLGRVSSVEKRFMYDGFVRHLDGKYTHVTYSR